jgi:hypothetical protein
MAFAVYVQKIMQYSTNPCIKTAQPLFAFVQYYYFFKW